MENEIEWYLITKWWWHNANAEWDEVDQFITKDDTNYRGRVDDEGYRYTSRPIEAK